MCIAVGFNYDQIYRHDKIPEYREFVERMIRRPKELGLSQEDLCFATGLGDCHINKLEAFDRIASFPTLLIWASALGLSVKPVPVDLPLVTVRAIDVRLAPLRRVIHVTTNVQMRCDRA